MKGSEKENRIISTGCRQGNVRTETFPLSTNGTIFCLCRRRHENALLLEHGYDLIEQTTRNRNDQFSSWNTRRGVLWQKLWAALAFYSWTLGASKNTKHPALLPSPQQAINDARKKSVDEMDSRTYSLPKSPGTPWNCQRIFLWQITGGSNAYRWRRLNIWNRQRRISTEAWFYF